MRAYILQVRWVDECINAMNILAVANILHK